MRVRLKRNDGREIITKKDLVMICRSRCDSILMYAICVWTICFQFPFFSPVISIWEMLQNGLNCQQIWMINQVSALKFRNQQTKKYLQKIEIKQEMNNQEINWRCIFRTLPERNRELLINRGHRASLSIGIRNAQSLCNTHEIVVNCINIWTMPFLNSCAADHFCLFA